MFLAGPSITVNGLKLRQAANLVPRRAITMFEVLKASTGYFWRLKGGNGEVLCHSEVYTTKQSAERGAETAKRIAPGASVVDRT
jgi:uncharacterized protein YegP (UPF0339 family)